MMKQNSFKRLLSFMLIVVLILQMGISGYAEEAPREKRLIFGQEKINRNVPQQKFNKEKPEGKKVINKELQKISPGLLKQEDRFEEWKNKKELVASRKSNSKTFANEDGSRTSVIFLEPIHVLKETGEYIDIDNTLEEIKENNQKKYKNKVGIFDVEFSTEGEYGTHKVTKDNIALEMKALDTKTKDVVVKDNKILYPSSRRGIDYLYTVMNTGVKEDIILSQYFSQNTFKYEVNIKGPGKLQLEDGVINVYDQSSKEVVYSISAPHMTDAEGNISYNLTLDLKKEKGKNIITLVVDDEWLKDSARVYPVMIDPTVKVLRGTGEIQDTFIQEGTTHYHGTGMGEIYVGHDDGVKSGNDPKKKRTRGIIKFQLPSDLTKDSIVEKAELNLYKYTPWSSAARTVNLHAIEEEYDINIVTWWNQPNIGSSKEDTVITGVGWYKWNIKTFVEGWLQGNANNGIMLKMDNEYAQGDVFRGAAASSNVPYITITYDAAPKPPTEPPTAGDLKLVLERNDKMEIGVAYAKGELTSTAEKNRATVKYRLLEEGPSGETFEENITELQWETEHFELELNKIYWIEADVLVEEWVQPPPVVDAEGHTTTPEGYFEETLSKNMSSDKFLVYEVQPGDTLKRIAKHYLLDGNRYTEVMELNKLDREALTVGQKLFIKTEKDTPYNYQQPNQVTPEMEELDATAGVNPINTEIVGQYINPHTGGFIYQQTDFSFPHFNRSITFTRAYSSTLEDHKSPLGDRWEHNFNKYLFFYNDGVIGYNTGEGSRIYYRKDSAGKYTTNAPLYDELNQVGEGYEIKTRDQLRYQFNQNGLLTSIIDENNNIITVSYDTNDWQTEIRDAVDRSITLQYYDTDSQWTGNIKNVILPNNSILEFVYNEENSPTTFVDGVGNTTDYTYDGNSFLKSIKEPRGNVPITNEYDGMGKVQKQTDGEQGIISLNYSMGRTTLKDGRGYDYVYTYNTNNWMTEKVYPDGMTEKFVDYDGKGNLLWWIDRKGDSHQYTYNFLGYNTTYIRPADQRKIEYRYRDGYLMESIIDFEGNKTEFSYEGNKLKEIKEFIKEDGGTKTLTTKLDFDTRGLLTRIEDPEGVIRHLDNSQYPYVMSTKDTQDHTSTYSYDSLGNTIHYTDGNNNETRWTVDYKGNILYTLLPGTEETTRLRQYVYDDNGQLKEEVSPRATEDGELIITSYLYDGNNRLIQTEDPYGGTIRYGYDENGNQIWEEDQSQNRTHYIFNKINLVEEVQYPGTEIPKEKMEYDPLGNLIKMTDAEGNWTEYQYDYRVGQVETVKRPEGFNIQYKYDNMGNVLEIIQPDESKTIYHYDSLYRPIKIDDSTGISKELKYDEAGNVKEIYKSTGRKLVHQYDSVGNLVNTSEFFSGIDEYQKSYTYDGNGNLLTYEDEEGNITQYQYNELNQVDLTIDPSGRRMEYDYDEEGNLSKTIDGEGNVTHLKYNANNQVETVVIPDGDITTEYHYLYDERGLREATIDPMGNYTQYKYDERGRLEAVTNPKQEVISYQYDHSNRLKKILHPNGQQETFEYDGLNQIRQYVDRSGVLQELSYTPMGHPKEIKDSVGNHINYTYDAFSRVEKIGDVLGRSQTYTYDEYSRIESIKEFDGNITSYKYDERGRVQEIRDPELKVTQYEYTGTDQVSQVNLPGERIFKYDYDPTGNLTKVVDPLGYTTEYKYNENNQLEEMINGRGHSKSYRYNALNLLTTVTDERSNTTSYDYYPGGALKTVTDPKNNKTDYTYDPLNRIQTVTNAIGETTQYEYDEMGNLKWEKDPRSNITNYTYTPRDQIEKIIDPEGNIIEKKYYPSGNLWKEIDQEHRVTEYVYDPVHRLIQKLEPNGYQKNYTYNPITGNIDETYDNAGQKTTLTYDKMHRLLTETDTLGNTTRYTYDSFGNLNTKTTPDGNTVTYGYDALNRLTSVLDPENKLMEIQYDPVGNIKSLKQPDNLALEYMYDPANNIEKITDSLGRVTSYTYDANNNMSTMLDPSGNLFNYHYDPLNRLEGVTDRLGFGQQYKFDGSGNLSQVIDSNNNSTFYQYNSLNQLEWVKDGEGNITRYTYYKDGQLKSMTDPRNNTTQYTYSASGQMEKFINPLGEIKEFQYNLLGQVEKVIKPDGEEINYSYDQYNRLEKILYPDDTSVEYQYDHLNRKTAMLDENGVTEYQYDEMGRLTWVSDYSGEEVSYEYDDKGRKSKVIYPDGRHVTYQYDDNDRVVAVIDGEGRKISYTYDAVGRRATAELPNGITTTYTYDEANRITEISNVGDQGNVVARFVYQYDGVGNRTVEEIYKEDKYYKREYTYYKNDTVKSMVETGDSNITINYQYDPAGNISEKVEIKDGVEERYTYEYNEANRMMTETDASGFRRSYRYDLNGNRTQRVISNEEEAEAEEKEVIDFFYYNYEDQLEEIVLHNGKVFTYGYDGEGNRLWRTHAQYPLVKPPVEEDERLEDPAKFPGYNKDKSNNGNAKTQTSLILSSGEEYASTMMMVAKVDSSSKGNSGKTNPSKDDSTTDSTAKDNSPKENQGNDKDNSSGDKGNSGNDKNNQGNQEKDKGNEGKNNGNNSNDKNEDEEGKGWAKGKDKDNKGKRLGWYKNGKANSNNPDIDLTNPEIFEVTNFINDINLEHTEVLMTSDVEGNYRGVYTYDTAGERISVEDLGQIEGKPNDPLYYLHDALGSVAAITNMNKEVIDSNRFGPYGEPLDPVAKNARLTNSPFGYTGEVHDIEARLVYLRARYYEPGTMRFLQQDTYLGEINDPLSRNLYMYVKGNPLIYTDPSGNMFKKIWQTLQEGIFGTLNVGPNKTWEANNLANETRSKAITYAQNNNPQYMKDGTLITWDNEADAYRHFTWNALMTRKMGYSAAEEIATSHETVLMRMNGQVKIKGIYLIYTLSMATLMDLHNNKVGRDMAASSRYKNKTVDELFKIALKENMLITSTNIEHVAKKYGFDPKYVNKSTKLIKIRVNILTKKVEYLKY